MDNRNKSKKGIGCIAVIIIVIILAALLAVGAKIIFDKLVNTPNDGSSSQIVIKIPPGTSTKGIAKILKEKDVIENETVFYFYTRLMGLDTKILAASYQTKGNKTVKEVTDDLLIPVSTEVKVTIPEGIKITQIAERLDQVLYIDPNWDKQKFLDLALKQGDEFKFDILKSKTRNNSLEGFLFPDTYVFEIEITPKDVINKMVENTQKRISGQLLTDIEKSGFTVYEVLNFASILERETQETKDRYLVGDVMYRRYKHGWTLGVDATLLYEKNSWKDPITYQDLQSDTPYNTRKFKGLPPTPICNPGLETIKGFVYREPNDYYYYVSDPNGKMYYAVTFSEHQENIKKYLK